VPSQPQIETDLRRLILFASNGAEVLVRHDGGRLDLPAVPIPPHQRVAENLTAFMRREWSQNAVSLFALNPSSTEWERRYQVTESTAAQPSTTIGFRWVSVSSLEENRFDEPADCTAIARARAQCEEYAAGRAHGPFGKLGWFAELSDWVRDRIRPTGLALSGRFTQLNAGPTFSLVRFETNGPAIWFKAVGEPNLREYPITLALAQYFSPFLPRIVATREDWNGWLAVEAAGAHPDETSDLSAWSRVVATLVKLQIASLGKSLHLLQLGCLDARIRSLAELMEPFFEVMVELMERQHKTSPAPLSQRELLTVRTQLEDLCSEFVSSEIPNSLGHFDFNPGNIVVGRDHCVFLDWSDAFVGHPFLTFQYLLEYLRKANLQDNSWECALLSTYAHHWQPFASPGEIARALECAPLLAVYAYAASGNAWCDPDLRSRPEIAGCLRSLARRMKREANRLRERGASWLS
jgi:hypothetical protein